MVIPPSLFFLLRVTLAICVVPHNFFWIVCLIDLLIFNFAVPYGLFGFFSITQYLNITHTAQGISQKRVQKDYESQSFN